MQSPNRLSQPTLGLSVTQHRTNQPWLPRPPPKYKRNLPRPSTKPSDGPMKEKGPNPPTVGHTNKEKAPPVEEEAPPEEADAMEEEAAQHQDHHEARRPPTRSPPAPTSPLTHDP